MSYPGGKNGAGVYQKIINLMPPHDVYVEPFLGGGAIMRNKKPAQQNIGIDRDARCLEAFPDIITIHECGIDFIQGTHLSDTALVYCDPPYLHSTRTKTKLYDFEMTDDDHIRFLNAVKALDCFVMISGYMNDLYAEELKDWNFIQFEAMTRGGLRTETLWFNFEPPTRLHDYSFIGEDFRDRERIKRKISRWVNKFKSLPDLERAAVIDSLSDEGIIHRQFEQCRPQSSKSAMDPASSSLTMLQALTGE